MTSRCVAVSGLSYSKRLTITEIETGLLEIADDLANCQAESSVSIFLLERGFTKALKLEKAAS